MPLSERRWCFDGRALSIASKGEGLRFARGEVGFAPFIVAAVVWRVRTRVARSVTGDGDERHSRAQFSDDGRIARDDV